MIWLGPEYENGGWLQTPTGGKKRFGVIIPAVISGSLRGSRRSLPITEGCRSGLTDCKMGVLPELQFRMFESFTLSKYGE